VSSDNPDAVLATHQWDVYITELGQLSTDDQALATAAGALTSFKNADVDKLIAKVAAGSALKQDAASALNLDQLLIKNHFGLPLFQLDGLVVWSESLTNYRPNPGNTSVAWGYSNWVVLAKGK